MSPGSAAAPPSGIWTLCLAAALGAAGLGAAGLGAAGCDDAVVTGDAAPTTDATTPSDRGGFDAAPTDAAPADAAPPDGPWPDADAHDVGLPNRDAEPLDLGADLAPADAGPLDAGPIDAGPIDAGPLDAGPLDAGPLDAAPPDAASAREVCDSGEDEDGDGLADCADPDCGPEPHCAPGPAYTEAELEIRFTADCSRCHPFLIEEFLARTYNREVVGLPIIAPGDHRRSYLWYKLAGNLDTIGGLGQTMPIGAPWPAGDVARFALWINGLPPID